MKAINRKMMSNCFFSEMPAFVPLHYPIETIIHSTDESIILAHIIIQYQIKNKIQKKVHHSKKVVFYAIIRQGTISSQNKAAASGV